MSSWAQRRCGCPGVVTDVDRPSNVSDMTRTESWSVWRAAPTAAQAIRSARGVLSPHSVLLPVAADVGAGYGSCPGARREVARMGDAEVRYGAHAARTNAAVARRMLRRGRADGRGGMGGSGSRSRDEDATRDGIAEAGCEQGMREGDAREKVGRVKVRYERADTSACLMRTPVYKQARSR